MVMTMTKSVYLQWLSVMAPETGCLVLKPNSTKPLTSSVTTIKLIKATCLSFLICKMWHENCFLSQ